MLCSAGIGEIGEKWQKNQSGTERYEISVFTRQESILTISFTHHLMNEFESL
jgi:hypothetical protein